MDDPGPYLGIAVVAGVVVAGALARAGTLIAVVVLCVAGFLLTGAEALSWLWLVLALPALGAAAVAGWGLGALPVRRVWLLPAGVAGIALVAWGALAARRATLDPVPAGIAAQVPHDAGALGALCFPDVPAGERRAARAQVRALARELPRHPDGLVTVGYAPADGPGSDERQRTLRELAEETLERSCPSPEATALRQALAASR